MADLTDQFVERIAAASRDRPLRIRGGGSKDFYGHADDDPCGADADVLDTRGHSGIVNYEPTELVITARCGTPLAEIEAALAQQNQFLAFEPPHFARGAAAATIGGVVATGLSGPRRAAVGAVRDFVLGVTLLGPVPPRLSFGGQVMKNVAGYDVSRLVTGSLGTLGLILEVSLKVLPRPVAEKTLRFDMDQAQALAVINAWSGTPLPISATCWHDHRLTLRLSGAEAAVTAAAKKLGGESVDDANAFWNALREQVPPFFKDGGAAPDALWRLSVPSVAAPLELPGPQLIEWGGSQRWWHGSAPAAREAAHRAGGHAVLFRAGASGDKSAGVFQPLPPALFKLHQRLKAAFDPHGVFNPGRMYPNL